MLLNKLLCLLQCFAQKDTKGQTTPIGLTGCGLIANGLAGLRCLARLRCLAGLRWLGLVVGLRKEMDERSEGMREVNINGRGTRRTSEDLERPQKLNGNSSRTKMGALTVIEREWRPNGIAPT